MSLLVVGSVALDSVETPFGKVDHALGGSATYFSLAASFFSPVRLVAVVGSDFSPEHVHLLKSRGVDTCGLQVADGETFRWAGRYEYDLNHAHTLDTRLNVFADFHPHLPESYAESDFVFLANIDPDLQVEVLRQVRRPRLTVLDTMNYWIEGKRKQLAEAISLVDVVLMNEAEARQFADTPSLVRAARLVLSLGPKAFVVKKGEYGAALFGADHYFVAPAYPLEEVRDPTGAGDSFAGGFVGYLAGNGKLTVDNLRRAMINGSVVASFTVEDFSVNRLARLARPEIDARYREFLSFTQFQLEE